MHRCKSPIKTFKHIMRSFTLFTSIILSIHLTEISNPTPALPFFQPCQKNLYLDMPLPITLAPDPVHLVSYTQHTSIFLLCNVSSTSADLPDIVPMFQVANLMQSGTLIKYSSVPTSFPAGHQVYNLHNDGNSILQLGRVPHRSVSCRRGLPTRYYGLYPVHFC